MQIDSSSQPKQPKDDMPDKHQRKPTKVQKKEEHKQSEDDEPKVEDVDEPVFFVILICNGKYNPNLFTLDIIKFLELPGHRADLNNAMKFLKKTAFNPDKYPENFYVIIDSSKEELELEWDKI